MVEGKFFSVYSTDTMKPLKAKEIRFTLFSTVAQLLEYGEIKYSKILLDLEAGEKKGFVSMQNQIHYSRLIESECFQDFHRKNTTVNFYSFITPIRLWQAMNIFMTILYLFFQC